MRNDQDKTKRNGKRVNLGNIISKIIKIASNELEDGSLLGHNSDRPTISIIKVENVLKFGPFFRNGPSFNPKFSPQHFHILLIITSLDYYGFRTKFQIFNEIGRKTLHFEKF